MTLREIAKKNLQYNIRKFTSYFLVNAFVVCTLFLYGSLLFNQTLQADPMLQGLRIIIIVGAAVVAMFAITFLIYTGFYFVRSRGKEFGVYLTLGMTHRDLVRMAVVESVIIFAGATVLGMGVGLLFGNLFYLMLGRFLGIPGNMFEISLQLFLFCLGTLAATFMVQLGMINVFIRRLSIANIAKATKTKDAVRQNPIVGAVSTGVLLIGIDIFLGVFFRIGIMANSRWFDAFMGHWHRVSPWSALVLTVIIFVCLFFTIGSGITVVAAVAKVFPRFYQRNILLFSGLTHKFRAYRTILFSMTLLTGFAVFLIGMVLAMYTATADDTAHNNPFDFSIEQRAGMNQISEAELRQIVEGVGGEIERIHILPYLDSRRFERHTEGRFADGLFWEAIRLNFLVSDLYFNRFTQILEPLVVAPHQLVIIYNAPFGLDISFNAEIAVEPFSDEIEIGFSATEWPQISMAGWNFHEDIIFATENPPILEFAQENIRGLYSVFTNAESNDSGAARAVEANVINHDLWSNLAEAGEVNHLMTFDLKSGNHAQVLDALITALTAANNLPDGIWDTVHPEAYSRLRPLSHTEALQFALRTNGFMFFVFAFIGIVFLVSTFIVLYHKFIADMDDEAESIFTFKKIGLTTRECRKYIQAHLGVVFFFPLLLGGGAALVIILRLFMSQEWVDVWFYFRYILLMYCGIVLFNIGLYAALRKRFFVTVKI